SCLFYFQSVLIPTPDITITPMAPNDQFILIGSDGLWDVLTNQNCVDFILKYVRRKKSIDSLANIATALVEHAYSLGSEDNITAIILFCTNNGSLPFKS